MILAFPAWRLGFFKATGGPITEALRRGHHVYAVHAWDEKPGEGITAEAIGRRWPAIRVASHDVVEAVDAVLGPSLGTYRARLPRAAHAYNLDLAWEGVSAPVGARLHHCWASALQRDTWVRTHGGGEGLMPALWAHSVTGSPMIDAFAPCPRGRWERANPQVVLMALKFPRNAGLWRRWIYRWIGYRRLAGALRRFCDRIGADLVVKTRAKNRDPEWLRWVADEWIVDGAFWPYTAAMVIQRARFIVHFQSGAALEAAFAGVPQLSVRLPHPHLRAYPGHAEQYEAKPGMQAWAGVVTGVGWETAVGYLDALQVPPLVDPFARQAYVSRFLGFDDCKTSARILDLVERGG